MSRTNIRALWRVGAVSCGLSLLAGCSESVQSSAPSHERSPVPLDGVQIADVSVGPVSTIIGCGPASDELLTQVAGVAAVRLADGSLRLAIADARDRQIRLFGTGGGFHGVVGGTGDGPGEFRNLRIVDTPLQSTFVAWDVSRSRLTSFSGDGEIVETTLFPVDGTLVSVADGIVAVKGGTKMFWDSDGLKETPTWIDVLDPRSGETLFNRELPPHREFVDMVFEPAIGTAVAHLYTQIFTVTASIAATTDGIIFTDGVNPTVRKLDMSGEERLIIEMSGFRVGVSDDLWNEAIEESLPDNPNPRRVVAASLAKMPRPDSTPGFAKLLVDDLGVIWAGRYSPAGPPTAWILFNEHADALGTVRTPPEVEVLEVTADWLIGRTVDPLTRVALVGVWPLTRGRRATEPALERIACGS